MSARAASRCHSTSALQPAMALRCRNWRRVLPLCSAIDDLQLLVRDVVDPRRGTGLGLEDLDLARLLYLRDQALGIALVAEVADATHAARDALREHAVREPVHAEVALARVADGQVLPVTLPEREVLVRRHRLVLRELRRSVRVVGTGVERARAVRARGHALPAPDALLVVDGHRAGADPARLLPRRAVLALHRACRDARRLVALHAGPRQERAGDRGVLAALVVVDRAVVELRRELVLGDARDGARVAPDALPHVEEHRPAPLLGRLLEGALQVFVHRDEDVLLHGIASGRSAVTGAAGVESGGALAVVAGAAGLALLHLRHRDPLAAGRVEEELRVTVTAAELGLHDVGVVTERRLVGPLHLKGHLAATDDRGSRRSERQCGEDQDRSHSAVLRFGSPPLRAEDRLQQGRHVAAHRARFAGDPRDILERPGNEPGG